MDNRVAPNKRLGFFLEAQSQNISTFAKELGTSQPTLSSIISGKRNLTSGMVARIAQLRPSLNINWLLTGEGEMLKDANEDEIDIIEDNDSEEGVIPFYDAETTGGYSGLVSSSDVPCGLSGYIKAGGWFDGRETAAIKHVGDSMTEYPNGCVLAVREVLDKRLLVPGRNYVVETTEYRVTKRVQKGSSPGTLALYSTNQEKYDDGRLVYEPFEIPYEDIRRIFSILGYIVNQSGEYRLIKP